MFKNIKNQINTPEVRQIMAACVFDDSPEGMDSIVKEYRRHSTWQMYGWLDGNDIIGVCGYEVHLDRVEILHIATCANARGRGIGRKMIESLRKQYNKTIEAETDDDAVDFYRKCGFETEAIRKYDVRRWICVLNVKAVRHIVAWNFKDGFTEEEKIKNAQKFKNEVEALVNCIDGIIELKVHINVLPTSNKDIILDSLFESEEALSAYQIHPEHQKVGGFAGTFLQDRACIDYCEGQ